MLSVNGYTPGYLVFSLVLALAPFIASILLAKEKSNNFRFWSLFIFLVVFFPNIPYLFTKGRYLVGYCGDNPWSLCGNSWAIGFFFAHAFVGVPLMYLTIKFAAIAIKRRISRASEALLAVVLLFISAIVLPIGLYGRFNSWNLFTNPRGVLSFAGNFVIDQPFEIIGWLLVFVFVYFLTDAFIKIVVKILSIKKGRGLF